MENESASDCSYSDTADGPGSDEDAGLDYHITQHKFGEDVFTAALLSFMSTERWCTFSAVLTVIVLLIQCGMSMAVLAYSIQGQTAELSSLPHRGWWNLANMNLTLPEEMARALCGTYQLGRASHVRVRARDARVALPEVVFFNKLPDWRWDTKWLGSERSVLDEIRYVITEGWSLFPNVAFMNTVLRYAPRLVEENSVHQWYGPAFMMVNLIWIAAVLRELRDIAAMALVLWRPLETGAAHRGAARGSQEGIVSDSAKCFGTSMCLFRGLADSFLYYTGMVLLRYSTSLVSLVMNSLGLLFVRDLGMILFKATLSRQDRDLVEHYPAVKYRYPFVLARFPWVVPLMASLVLVAEVGRTRYFQLQIFRKLFDDTASLCLFGGPPTFGNSSELLAPVPGFCESLLKLTCVPHGIDELPQGPCFVTDSDVPWPKDVPESGKEHNIIWPSDIFNTSLHNIWHWDYNVNASKKFRLIPWYPWWQVWEDGSLTWKVQKQVPYRHDLHLLQKVCRAMYHPRVTMRKLDDSYWDGDPQVAPFYCRKEHGLWIKSLKQAMRYRYHYTLLGVQDASSGSFIASRNLGIYQKNARLGEWLYKCMDSV